MNFLSNLVRKIRGGEEGPQEIVVKGTSLGMGWFDARDKLAELAGGTSTALLPRLTTARALKYYRSWIFSAINLIQRKVVETDTFLYREKGEPNDEEYDRILVHPLLRLLARPNPFISGRELKQITQTHLDLVGMAFWLVLFNGYGLPGEIHILSPTWLTNIILGDRTDNLIQGFRFAPPNNRLLAREYQYKEIVYFHYPDPENHLLPLSPLQPLSHVLDIDLLLQVYEKDFFNNNARPDGILRSQQDIMEDEAARIQESWEAKHRGPGRQHKVTILSGGLDYQPLGMSAKDFEFGMLSEYVKDQILASYGIPEAELGLFESFNKASSLTSENKFVKGCIEPRLRLWEDVINTQLLTFYPGSSELLYKHESALPKDDEWQLTETQGNLSMGLTSVNEERKKRGWKPWKSKLFDVPWTMTGEPVRGEDPEADKLWDEKMKQLMGPQMPGMEAPTDSSVAQGPMGALGGRPEGQALSTLLNSASRRTNVPLSTLLNAARGRRGGLAALMANHPGETSFMSAVDRNRTDQALSKLLGTKGYDFEGNEETLQEMAARILESQLDEIDRFMFRPYEKAFAQIDVIEEEYREGVKEFLVEKGIEISGITYKILDGFTTKGEIDEFDWDRLREEYEREAEPYVMKAVDIGFRFGNELVLKAGKDYKANPEYYAMDAAGKFLHLSADLKVASTKKIITQILKDGIESGASTDDIAAIIKNKFANISGPRAMMIARTEMSGALNAGMDANWRQINADNGLTIKEARIWTALDERVCDECEEKHNDLAIDYIKNVVYIQLGIHPNCRCVYMPILA